MTDEVIGTGTIRLTGDASGFTASVNDAKKAATNFNRDLGNTTQAAASKAQQAVGAYIEKLKLAAQNAGKTATEIKLLDLQQRGATQGQLAAAAAYLKVIDAHKAHQAELRRTAAAQAELNSSQAAASRLIGPLTAIRSLTAGIVAGLSGVSLGALFKGFVDGLDSLNDAADATGSSVEKLSALEQVALRTGTSLQDSVTPSIDKLNQALRAKADSEQARALRAIGLSAEELRQADPADALRKVAEALSGYADNGDKARLVQTLLGKSARELAPFLKDLAEKGDLVSQVTTEQAASAEKFNQQLALLTTTATNAGRSIAADMLPSLNQMAQLFLELKNGPGLVASIGQAFVGNTFRTASQGLDFYNDKLRALDKQMADLRADKRPLVATNNAKVLADLEQQRAALAKFADAYRNVVNAGGAGAGRGFTVPGAGDKPAVVFGDAPEKDGAKSDPYATMLASLRERIALLGREGELERVNAQIRLGAFGKLSEARALQLRYAAIAIDQYNDEQQQLKGVQAAQDAATEALTRRSSAAAAGVVAYELANRSLAEEIELMGASATARAAIENARIEALITTKEQQIAERELAGLGEQQNQLLQKEIDLLRERQQLNSTKAFKEAEQQLQETGEKARTSLSASVAEGLLEGFRKGNNLADVFLRELKAQFARTVLQPAIEPIVTGMQGTASSIGSGLFNLVQEGLKWLTGSGAGVGITSGSKGLVDFGLGGGRASGGPVEKGRLYRVNELGPELLNLAGQQYLMMGNQSGSITPHDESMRQLGGGMSQAMAAQVVRVASPVTIINQTSQPVQATSRQTPDGGIEVLLQAAVDLAADGVASGSGPLSKAFEGRYGLRPSMI